jgi:hypothetical protein
VINDISTPEAGIAKVNEKWASMNPVEAEFELAKRQDLVQS